MKFKFNLILMVLLFVPMMACNTITVGNTVNGSGNIISKSYEVSNFSHVTLAGIGDVYITQGDTESLSVKTDDNIFAQLDIRVRGAELILATKPNVSLNPSRAITYTLTVKNLNDITLAGSGNIYSEAIETDDMKVLVAGSGDIDVKGLSGKDLSINLSGSGDITIAKIAVTALDTSINGSGDINLTGKADAQTINVNGSGKYVAGNLETANANISIAGSGNVTIWVKEKLDVHVNGSGDVSYYGKPTVSESGGGSGNVTSLGEK